MNKNINVLFGATSDYLKYASVILISILDNLENDVTVNAYFLYADIVRNISDEQRTLWFETANYFFKDKNVNLKFIDVSDKISMFENLNVGMWGKEVSLTHYMYLLAPIVLEKNIKKVIYLDCDTCVNCNLAQVFSIDMQDKLIAMGAPRGFEEMGEDVCNSGFSILNIAKWREENTLETLVEYGLTLKNKRFCDQYLLHNYFKTDNPDKLLLLDYRYNIFPQYFNNLEIKDIKIMHYTGYFHYKPWDDLVGHGRGSFLWWQYARKSPFYETFISDYIDKKFNNLDNKIEYNSLNVNLKSLKKPTFWQLVFSVRNSDDNSHKIVTVLGIRIKLSKNYIFKISSKKKKEKLLKQWYKTVTGKTLDLDNPQTFNEKIQWLKLYDSTPIKTRLADKYLVRDWVKEKIGEEYLIPLLGVWNKFDEINFDQLPNQFVLKCNHGSGYNIIVKDKTKLNIEEARQKINTWMTEDYAFKFGYEIHYSKIPRKIIAEKYIADIAGGDNADFHIFCFSGKPKLFYLTNAKDINKRTWAFYDINFNKLPIQHPKYKIPAKLDNFLNTDLNKILKIAKKLSSDFYFVRVDLFLTNEKIYFGKMTFTPSSGAANYESDTWEKDFGQLIKLPRRKNK